MLLKPEAESSAFSAVSWAEPWRVVIERSFIRESKDWRNPTFMSSEFLREPGV